MDSFNIDEFLDENFKVIESEKRAKKKKKVLEDDKSGKTIDENEGKTYEIYNCFKNENTIDLKIYDNLNLNSLKKYSKNAEEIIKPLYPNEEVFKSEFTEEKGFMLDKFIRGNKDKNRKKKQPRTNYTKGVIKQLKRDNNIKYEDLLELNELWVQYIKELLNNNLKEETIANKMLKADLHGAVIKVINSTNKNNINLEGIVIFESRRTFNVVNKRNQVKTLLKSGNVFSVKLGIADYHIEIIGDNFIYKSSERTKVKFKHKYNFNYI